MKIFEYHQGCPITEEFMGCYGPSGPYYTLFGTELRFLSSYMLLSIFIGLVLMSILFTLNKKEKIHLQKYQIYVIPLIITVVLFFLLAYLIPIKVMY